MKKVITIDPITRLEGHGKISIFLDDSGNVENAFFQVPEFRGFEKFCEGRAAEEMPRITSKICGVCPTAHHMASTKTLDSLFKVEPTSTAKKVRELVYNLFMFEDHLLHFFFLGGPDFLVGPEAPKEERNVIGVIKKFGVEIGKKVIQMRKDTRKVMAELMGRPTDPIFGMPGGISKGITNELKNFILKFSDEMIEFAKFVIKTFHSVVLENESYKKMILNDAYKIVTHYMGLVDENNFVNFYDGKIRVVSSKGKEIAKFPVEKYYDYIAENVEEWSYIKFPYLKSIGWKGFIDGDDSGIYRVAPLARLNVADGMATELANQEYKKMFDILEHKPVHHTLAYHWARLIEVLYAAERVKELISDKEITSDNIRNIPKNIPDEGIGVVEAPRGTLIHHYKTDENGILKKVNLIVATVNNSAAICLSIKKAAESLIKNGQVSDGILNKVEMAFRAYDPCFACATHSFPGEMPLIVEIYDKKKNLIKTIKRL